MRIDKDLYMEQALRRDRSFATVEAIGVTKHCFAKLFRAGGAPTAADFRKCIAKAEEAVRLLEIDEVTAEKNVQIWRVQKKDDQRRVGRDPEARFVV